MHGTTISSLERTVEELQREVRSAADNAADELAQRIDQVRSVVTVPLEKVHRFGSELDPRPLIRSHPLAALGIAFGAAFLYGSRKRHSSLKIRDTSRQHGIGTIREAVLGCIMAFATQMAREGFERVISSKEGESSRSRTYPARPASDSERISSSLFDTNSVL